VVLYYDEPTAPAGTFDPILSVPNPLVKDVETRTWPFLFSDVSPQRAHFDTANFREYTPRLIAAIANETEVDIRFRGYFSLTNLTVSLVLGQTPEQPLPCAH
jgi:hypothetical protein